MSSFQSLFPDLSKLIGWWVFGFEQLTLLKLERSTGVRPALGYSY